MVYIKIWGSPSMAPYFVEFYFLSSHADISEFLRSIGFWFSPWPLSASILYWLGSSLRAKLYKCRSCSGWFSLFKSLIAPVSPCLWLLSNVLKQFSKVYHCFQQESYSDSRSSARSPPCNFYVQTNQHPGKVVLKF